MAEKSQKSKVPASFRVGAIALVFLIIGYQVALLVYRASVAGIVAHRDRPDTVYVVDRELAREVLEEMAAGDRPPLAGTASQDASADQVRRQPHSGGLSGGTPDSSIVIRRNSPHSPTADAVVREHRPRTYESFRFNPNTATAEDFQRLGFSEKQAASIVSYREKGGRFRRKTDFAKSFVVADSVYRRLEAYIDIPLVDINKADSAAFDSLPGIGPYFASKMVSYREELGGYSYPEQLMDIWHFDREKYDGLKDLIEVGESAPYQLWTLPEEELRKHPYIGRSAHAVVLWRSSMPRDSWTVSELGAASVLPAEMASKLSRCNIAVP